MEANVVGRKGNKTKRYMKSHITGGADIREKCREFECEMGLSRAADGLREGYG